MAQQVTGRVIERINNFGEKWRIKTNINNFTVLRIGAKKREQLIAANNNINGTRNQGKILRLNITNNGFYRHIQQRKDIAIQSLNKLYRFNSMPTEIKIHLIKTLIIPDIDYPPVPIHALSVDQLGILQRVQN